MKRSWFGYAFGRRFKPASINCRMASDRAGVSLAHLLDAALGK
jgi:hypothetical protein